LPDSDDRHVLAAALHAGAQGIVTFNVDDFPRATLHAYQVEALHPDRFVLGLIDMDERRVRRVLDEQVAAPRRSEPVDIITRLARIGLLQTAAALRELCGAS
jgi:hypothetical protein